MVPLLNMAGLLLYAATAARAAKIACVGDSITYGSTASDPFKTAFPAWLFQSALAGSDDHEVVNFGVSGATMMKEGDKPYWLEPQFEQAISWEPDVVLIQLGTNDAKTYQWDEDAYVSAYVEMINEFVSPTNPPKIYISIPPPLYTDGVYEMDQQVINERLPVLIPSIAASNANVTGVVDVFNAMGGAGLTKYELFCNLQSCDECHPNDLGYSLMATVFYKAVFLS